MVGISQAAHIKDGSGTTKSGDNNCLPLCANRPDKQGCHSKQHGTSERKFWGMSYDDAIETANDIYLNTGDREFAVKELVKLRKKLNAFYNKAG